MNNWIWGTIGALLVVVELLAPGYFLIFAALGALVVAGAGFAWPMDIEGQLALFAGVSALLFVLGFPWYRRLTGGATRDLVNSPNRLVGAAATVEDPITGGEGKIRLGDTVWLARGPDLPRGTKVTVTAVDGTILQVAPRG